ncbi:MULTISPECIES: hypothetical protein [unclassified Streptomyces]|uniref:hypothetical protein n=1 Tax=unclassified Streptomyces TaxID=2593676 RepID=UPI00371B20C2
MRAGARAPGRHRGAERPCRHSAGDHRHAGPAGQRPGSLDFGISTDRTCLEIQNIFYDADDDVLRHTVTVDYSGRPYVTRYEPTLEEMALRE